MEDEDMASALGYVSQIVVMIAKYLQLPLRFPIKLLCSRTSIRDEISLGMLDKDREYDFASEAVVAHRPLLRRLLP
eukprot:m.732801 g.732801  ORF g.732801 m.732801 type:complete len:76 (+) comp58873_c0_seq10:1389-1616(+)